MRYGFRKRGLRGLLLLVLCLSLTPALFAKNSARYYYSGFTSGQQSILKKAVDIAVSRIQERDVWLNTYSQARYALVTTYAFRESHLLSTDENSWNLLWRQLYYLSLPNDADDTTPAFPDIHIRGQYAPPEMGKRGWLGHAPLNKVSIVMTNGAVRQTGEFELTLNTYYLGRSEFYSDPNEWAATIAHEMLHNLGHRHDDSSVDYESLQIIALDRAVKANGRYVRPKSQAKMAEVVID